VPRSRLVEVCRAWHEAVGEEVSLHSRVGGFKGGVLWVEVDSAARRYELSQFQKEDILKKMRRSLPGEYIDDIRFKVAEWGM